MDEMINYVMSHQFTVVLAVLCALFLTWFLFKKLFKLALLVLIVFAGFCGYFYLKNPDTARENIMKTVETAEKKTLETLEKSKTTYNKGKEYVEKGKQRIEGIDQILSPNADKATKP